MKLFRRFPGISSDLKARKQACFLGIRLSLNNII